MIPASDARNDYVGNSTATAFTGEFRIDDETEVAVYRDGVLAALNVDYTVSGVGADEHTVTFLTAPGTGVAVTLIRAQPLSQLTDYIRNEPFPSERVETDFDKLIKTAQMLQEQLRRALKYRVESTLLNPILPDGEEGKILRWLTETELENVDPADYLVLTVAGVPVTLPLAINEGGTASTTAADARTALGVPGLATVNTFTQRNIWNKGTTIASATTITIPTDGNYFDVSGTTTITGFQGMVAGLWFILRFTNILTLTHSTNLRLPNKSNIVTKSNDIGLFVADSATAVRCVSYVKSNEDDAESSNAMFPGMMMLYGGTSAPTGWLLCDGAAISRTTYLALFTAIGTAFGSGDGSTTFNVPDLRGRFPAGKAGSGTFVTLGSTGGVETLPNHTHSTPAHTHTLAEGAGVANSDTSGKIIIDSAGDLATPTGTIATENEASATTESGGAGTSGNPGTSPSIVNPFQVVNYIIKT